MINIAVSLPEACNALTGSNEDSEAAEPRFTVSGTDNVLHLLLVIQLIERTRFRPAAL